MTKYENIYTDNKFKQLLGNYKSNVKSIYSRSWFKFSLQEIKKNEPYNIK